MSERVVFKAGKKLRCGYTTGTCAAAAATAAAEILLTGKPVSFVSVKLPNKEDILFTVNNTVLSLESACCSVTKDSGDDPDVTNGIEIFARCRLCEEGIHVLSGEGIGVVTCKGLPVEVGKGAINPVPMKMIKENLLLLFKKEQYKNGMKVTLSVPGGEDIAKKTFNERLGIIGGISILGTTGIVEPMSEKALVDTLKLEIDQYKEKNQEILMVFLGNYGQDYCKNNFNLGDLKGIKCSNYIGEVLDYALYKRFKKILLVGHIGKLVKLAGGIMNTHSKVADCRMEILSAHGAIAGGSKTMIEKIMEAKTTKEALGILDEANLKEEVLESILNKILFHVNYRVQGKLSAEVLIFSDDGLLVKSRGTDGLVEDLKENSLKFKDTLEEKT